MWVYRGKLLQRSSVSLLVIIEHISMNLGAMEPTVQCVGLLPLPSQWFVIIARVLCQAFFLPCPPLFSGLIKINNVLEARLVQIQRF